MKDIIRRCRFAPYRTGMGPTFSLVMWDTGRTIGGKSRLGYRLTMHGDTGTFVRSGDSSVVLFEGEDYGCSPLHAIDSDAAVEGVMSFLTLRPGDTDSEYFADYTPAQLAYCAQHAEVLNGAVMSRFCCVECGACAKRNRAGYCERCAGKAVRS